MEVFVLKMLDYDCGTYIAGVYTSRELAIEAARNAGMFSDSWLVDIFTLNAPAE